MLQRLEFTNQLAELLALLEVGGGHVERAASNADALCRSANTPGIEHAVQQLAASVDFANHGIGIDLDAIQLDVGRHRAVNQPDSILAEPGSILRHGEQGDPVMVIIGAGGAGRDDQHIGAAAVDHKGLLAGQLEAVAGALGAGGNSLWPVLRAFVDRDGKDAIPGQQARQVAAAQFIIARANRRCRHDRARQERRRGQVAADFFKHDTGFDMAHAEAAIGFTHQNAGEAEFGKLLP